MIKKPEECNTIIEIRDVIDELDHEIIQLFTKRFGYVKEIVRFKNDKDAIIAEDRKEQVIKQRRIWADEGGLDADVFEDIYRVLINDNIKKELVILNKRDDL